MADTPPWKSNDTCRRRMPCKKGMPNPTCSLPRKEKTGKNKYQPVPPWRICTCTVRLLRMGDGTSVFSEPVLSACGRRKAGGCPQFFFGCLWYS